MGIIFIIFGGEFHKSVSEGNLDKSQKTTLVGSLLRTIPCKIAIGD
jgi:hypothetical protein